MKVSPESLYLNKNYNRVLEWVKLIALTGGAQLIVQALGFFSGILIIRLLPTHEYALYTLANTMLGTMTILADGGIATGVMYRGGRVWNDREKLGRVLVTGLDLRKKFAIGSLIIAVPLLFFLLRHHGASWTMTILLIISLVPAFFSALSGSLLEIVPKLHQNILPVQKNQVGINIGRLLLIGLTLAIFPWAFIAILGSGIPQIWGNMRLRKISSFHADRTQIPDVKDRAEILKVVRRTLPGAVYYCISGQITIWLISIFGNTTTLAQVGALTRISILFSIFSVLFSTLMTPRFARLRHDKSFIIRRFIQVQGLLLILCMILFVLFNFFSNNILTIFGNRYAGLDKELILVVIGGCLGLVSLCTNQLLSSRGLIISPYIFIPLTIAIQVGLAFSIHLNQLDGVLLYGILTTASIYLMRLIYFFIVIKNHEVTS
ncbi:MAG: lipopolysaccharide biosynthesis protein [Flavisolibacter sp.]|jgi:O-antigen/teichoic acid export membrane protein